MLRRRCQQGCESSAKVRSRSLPGMRQHLRFAVAAAVVVALTLSAVRACTTEASASLAQNPTTTSFGRLRRERPTPTPGTVSGPTFWKLEAQVDWTRAGQIYEIRPGSVRYEWRKAAKYVIETHVLHAEWVPIVPADKLRGGSPPASAPVTATWPFLRAWPSQWRWWGAQSERARNAAGEVDVADRGGSRVLREQPPQIRDRERAAAELQQRAQRLDHPGTGSRHLRPGLVPGRHFDH